MPVYVYQATSPEKGCEHCTHEFEVVQAMRDDPLPVCPKCGSPVRRIIQPVGVRMGNKALLSDQNLKQHGFTKLVNEGGGKFRKI